MKFFLKGALFALGMVFVSDTHARNAWELRHDEDYLRKERFLKEPTKLDLKVLKTSFCGKKGFFSSKDGPMLRTLRSCYRASSPNASSAFVNNYMTVYQLYKIDGEKSWKFKYEALVDFRKQFLGENTEAQIKESGEFGYDLFRYEEMLSCSKKENPPRVFLRIGKDIHINCELSASGDCSPENIIVNRKKLCD